MFTTGVVRDGSVLREILLLQKENLPAGLSPQEVRDQGFVTVEHSLDVLAKMHTLLPSVVAHENDSLVGYALSMATECSELIPVLRPLFDVLGRIELDGRLLADRPFYVMGQVCVAKTHRGLGVFDALYAAHRQSYASRFELLVTEISERNTRSLRAHARVGFRVVHRYRDETDAWNVVAWDWR